MATPCHPPSVPTPRNSAGLADFLLDVFFYPGGKDEGGSDHCRQLFQMKGRDALAVLRCRFQWDFAADATQTHLETQKRKRTPHP